MKDFFIAFIAIIVFSSIIYIMLKMMFRKFENAISSRLVNIIISVPEFHLKFEREIYLHSLHQNHKIFHLNLGNLTIEKTIDICVDNSTKTKLSVYVSMPDLSMENMIKLGEDEFIKRMREYGFSCSK
jgi:hypothetical protein